MLLDIKQFKRLCILSALLPCSLVIWGQQVEVKGSVEMAGDEQDIIYNVLALRADSSIYKGNVFMDKHFSLPLDMDSVFALQLSGLGYEPIYFTREQLRDKTRANVTDIGSVRLVSNLSLDEITVTANRKRIAISPTGYSVDIKDSYLADYGRFDDVIRRIPGITVAPRGTIEVIGKSNPLFILNGRRLNSSDDLKRLDPKRIKSIHVDQEPGPEYDASYDAVVRVETTDRSQEFYAVSVVNNFSQGRRTNDDAQVVVDAQSGNFTYSLEMKYGRQGNKQYDTEYKSVWNEQDTISTNRVTTLSGNYDSGIFAPTIQWKLNDNNKIEAIYRLGYSGHNSTSNQEYEAYTMGGKEFANTYLKEKEKRTSHNPSFYYTYSNDIHNVRLSVDYYRMNTKNNQDVDELYENGNTNKNIQDFRDKYEIYGGALDYSAAVNGWDVTAGGKASGIRDDGRYLTNNDPGSFSLLKDNTYALYAGLAKSVSAFSLSASLRAELNTVNYSSSNYAEPVKSNFFNLFPSLTARYNGTGFSASLAYTRRIKRPSFDQLNPNQSYIDPLSYITGNPLLKSRITDNVTLQLQHSNLVFTATYGHQKNPLAGIIELTDNNKIAYTNVNMPAIHVMDLVAIYSFNRNWFKSNLLLQARLNDIHYQGVTYSKFRDKPTFIARLNLDFDLWKGASLNLTGFCYNNYKIDVTRMRNTGYVSVELGQNILRDKLRLTVGGMDLFKSYNANTWSVALPNSITRMATNADSRYVYVILQFKFGKMKSVESSGSIITEEKGRL